MKQTKIFSVLAIALALGLTACGGGSGSKATSSKHTHKWVQDTTKQNVEATCAQEGITYEICEGCKETREKKTSKKSHTYGEWQTVAEADCTHAGSRKRVCSVCNNEETEVIEALGHNWGETTVTQEPGIGVEGKGTHTCSRCNTTEEVTIDALVPSVSITTAKYELNEGKVYLVLSGTEQYFTAENFKWAFGLKLDREDTWLVGKAEPEAADFNVLGVITPAAEEGANDSFEVKFDLTSIPAPAEGSKAGLWNIYAGPTGAYGSLNVSVSNTENGNTPDEAYNYYFRNDQQTSNRLTAGIDALPLFHFTTAVASKVEDQVWVNIGGKVRDASLTKAALDTQLAALDPFIQFQSTGNSYFGPEGHTGGSASSPEGLTYSFESKEEADGLYAYLKINITFMGSESATTYNTHVNVLANKQQNCVMEQDFLGDAIDLGNDLELIVFSNSTGAYNEQLGVSGRNAINSANNAYGNLGFRVQAKAAEQQGE